MTPQKSTNDTESAINIYRKNSSRGVSRNSSVRGLEEKTTRMKINDAIRRFLVYPQETDQFRQKLIDNGVEVSQSLFWMIEEYRCGFAHNFNTFSKEIFGKEV